MPNGGHYNRKTTLRKQHAWPAMRRRLERGRLKLEAKRLRRAARELQRSAESECES